MVTKRDLQVVEFLEKFHIATTSTIETLFYPSNRVARNRLNALVDAKMVKRDRAGISCEYEYYIRRPAQYRHSLLLTDLYREMHRRTELYKFIKEPKIGDIRPDALAGYKANGVAEVAFVEIEISHKGLDIEKYERLYYSGEYRKYFVDFPKLIVVSDRKVPKSNKFDITVIDTEFKNLKL